MRKFKDASTLTPARFKSIFVEFAERVRVGEIAARKRWNMSDVLTVAVDMLLIVEQAREEGRKPAELQKRLYELYEGKVARHGK